MSRLLTIIFSLVISQQSIYSQVTIENQNDAKLFLEEYLSPMGEGLGAMLNNGWYNSARTHKFGGFDVSISLNSLFIPKAKKSFDPNTLSNFSSNTETPTILGKGEGALVEYNGNEFKLPNQASSISILALPTANIGIGLIKKTEINARYIPNYNFQAGFAGKGEVSLWGIGFKHDILQWIPIIGDAIPLSVSLQAGYTDLSTKQTILNQKVNINTKAANINIIASRKILMLTGFASLGYSSSISSFNVATSPLNEVQYFNLGDLYIQHPIDMEFQRFNDFRANIGLRFNIALIAFQANYTLSEYSVFSIGAGVSFR